MYSIEIPLVYCELRTTVVSVEITTNMTTDIIAGDKWTLTNIYFRVHKPSKSVSSQYGVYLTMLHV